MSSKEKDALVAIAMLGAAHRKVKAAQRCEGFMRYVMVYSPQYVGLAAAAQRHLRLARLLLQAARSLHPATTPKSQARAANPGPFVQQYGRGFRLPVGYLAAIPPPGVPVRSVQEQFLGFFGE